MHFPFNGKIWSCRIISTVGTTSSTTRDRGASPAWSPVGGTVASRWAEAGRLSAEAPRSKLCSVLTWRLRFCVEDLCARGHTSRAGCGAVQLQLQRQVGPQPGPGRDIFLPGTSRPPVSPRQQVGQENRVQELLQQRRRLCLGWVEVNMVLSVFYKMSLQEVSTTEWTMTGERKLTPTPRLGLLNSKEKYILNLISISLNISAVTRPSSAPPLQSHCGVFK